MSAPLFDSYLIVDWSASNVPKRGKDSIWWALVRPRDELFVTCNPVTRREAIDLIVHLLASEADLGHRILAGFDFPFGYPAGVAASLTSEASWSALWDLLSAGLCEEPGNRNNRLELAASLNARFTAEGPFWGNGKKEDIPGLPRRKPVGWGSALPREWRLVERFQRKRPGANPFSVWQLSGAGAVGGQVLTGIPAVRGIRSHPRLAGRTAVWPFEHGLADPGTQVVLAEIYPSLLDAAMKAERKPDEIKDAAQVRVTARAYANLDATGRLAPLFAGAPDLTADERALVAREEAWILGAGHEDALRTAA